MFACLHAYTQAWQRGSRGCISVHACILCLVALGLSGALLHRQACHDSITCMSWLCSCVWSQVYSLLRCDAPWSFYTYCNLSCIQYRPHAVNWTACMHNYFTSCFATELGVYNPQQHHYKTVLYTVSAGNSPAICDHYTKHIRDILQCQDSTRPIRGSRGVLLQSSMGRAA